MSTSTMPDLASPTNAATVPISELAWAEEETALLVAAAPRDTLMRTAIASVLLGAISVIAALCALALDRPEAPRTVAVVDGLHVVSSMPSAPSASSNRIPPPAPSASAIVRAPAPSPTRAAIVVTAPPVIAPPAPTTVRHEWQLPSWEQHDWDFWGHDEEDDEPTVEP